MTWLEVSVSVLPEAAEAVSEVLSRYAPEGVAIVLDPDGLGSDSPVTVKAYLKSNSHVEEQRHKIEEGLWYLHQIWQIIPEPTFTTIADQDWTAGWKDSIPVLHIGRRVVIKPSWREYVMSDDEVVLELDPGLAFGSGLHPTTQLCIEALDDLLHPGMHVLDIGTGTGILALVAAKLGADHVLALDTDDDAVTAALRNIRHNNAQTAIRLKRGSLAGVEGEYDMILANILAPVIISMVEAGLAKRLRPEGLLVVSGILAEQVDEVKTAMHRHGLRVVESRQKEDWAALVAKCV
jgi:ribosomal protein L11 methyltransferase